MVENANEMHRTDILKRLSDLDEEASLLFDDAERLHVIIVGGGALVLAELISRSTHDIDAMDVSQKLQNLIATYDINTKVKTYINNFPYNYEDRICLVMQGKIVDVFIASVEDIVIAKLHSNRDTDISDIEDSAVVDAIDWDVLRTLAVEEAELSALNDYRHQEFLDAYSNYERRFRR